MIMIIIITIIMTGSFLIQTEAKTDFSKSCQLVVVCASDRQFTLTNKLDGLFSDFYSIDISC